MIAACPARPERRRERLQHPDIQVFRRTAIGHLVDLVEGHKLEEGEFPIRFRLLRADKRNSENWSLVWRKRAILWIARSELGRRQFDRVYPVKKRSIHAKKEECCVKTHC